MVCGCDVFGPRFAPFTYWEDRGYRPRYWEDRGRRSRPRSEPTRRVVVVRTGRGPSTDLSTSIVTGGA
jgi:hypothetical protein